MSSKIIGEGTWKLKQFWECQQCFGLLSVEVEEVRCDSCHPLDAIKVTSEDFQKDVSKYVKLSEERVIRVGDDGGCYMTMGPCSRMR